MHLQFEEYIFDIAEAVSKSLGDKLDISTTRWITRPVGKEQVRDATLAFYVNGKRRMDDIVLLISNPSFPSAVQADVANAREIAVRVGQQVGSHIAAPLNEGIFGKQTYAAFARLSPLSGFRLVKALQKPAVTKRVLHWIVQLENETKQHRDTPEDMDRYFYQPLLGLRDNKDVSEKVRERAVEYLETLRDGRIELFTVAQHGDFWIGNVFFQRRVFHNLNPKLGNFSIIDWRGCRLDGYPCTDWMRFCSSLYKTGSNKNSELVSAYRKSLGISTLEFQVYCFLAMGRLGAELDQFPKDRYISLCDQTLDFIDAHSRLE